MSDKNNYCMVLTTVNNQQVKQDIIQRLLEKRLAACIQVMPIESHYLWQEKICQDSEELLIIKTESCRYPEIESAISQLHDYDVPQIVKLPFSDGFNPYLSWISASVK